ncbi:phospholipase D family protein [Tropicibacter sp. Alg240-R139]|uniref:phospholipase D family protein n=1 Tax=Tropicibacter sp. Alg240-R139 TaxID=2305991 RepID=UPI0013DF40D7|nr:phospholipase D family protein [Tropicibacter sp. Alg240-R139]
MLKTLRFLIIATLCYVFASFGFQWLFPVPHDPGRENSSALPARSDTTLGGVVLPLMEQHVGTSGVAGLQDGAAAFAARLLLIDAAEQSLDVRYYIWQKDITGLLLLDALQRAAERGVRVRLLLDDNGTPDLDPELAEMDAHENIEVRLFNPFMLRSPRMASYALDFGRINRRMHNKSLTVDGVATVVGGRNVGDIYFSRSEGVNYFDMDVVAIGDAAADVSVDFDIYWASSSAVPVSDVLVPRPVDGGILDASVAQIKALPGGEAYAESVRASNLMEELLDDARGFDWVPMQMVSDSPVKGQGAAQEDDLMMTRLIKLLPNPEIEVSVISAYFVPGNRFTEVLTTWAGDGIRVRTLTNAQEATDVLPVHSGYVPYRDRLIDGGVEVYELKSNQVKPDLLEQFGLVGSSNTSLHAKTFEIDGQHIFVGSFNFDPRSARLNTEMGFLIDSSELAGNMARGLDRQLPERAYKVERGDSGELHWIETEQNGADHIYPKEPKTTALSRTVVWIMGLLPIQWML